MNKQIIGQILLELTEKISQALGENLVGLYLFGSLTYGDFHEGSSDIDLMAILRAPANPSQLELLTSLHADIAERYPEAAKRVECSYTPISMLQNSTPPREPRPYYGENIFWPEAKYGNEWIINLYLLHTYGRALLGPDFKTLVPTIDIREVQKAACNDLFTEWEPKLKETSWLDNSHYQSYLVLNLCRIFYTVMQAEAQSKKVAAEWVKSTYPEWKKLIETAQNWQYGLEMSEQEKTLDFLRFVIQQVKESHIARTQSHL